jgi:SPX domain protein involved in polyphosphate accumulation
MDEVKLMNRTEIKFAFHLTQLDFVLNELKNNYKVLEVEAKRISRYESLYFDTDNLDLYTQHHNGRSNRYKIRQRNYVESGTSFFEIKFKNNKGRTLKNRIEEEINEELNTGAKPKFLSKHTPFSAQDLKPVLWINYNRITLVNKSKPERLTIDTGLEFIKGNERSGFNGLVIAELKQENRKDSPFLNLMKQLRIKEGSLSKYCTGIGNTYANAKKNNFKQRLNQLKQYVYAN